ncbi:hypothetical protein RND81_05G023000 [Saponaria officinalis]|uniref:Uncharacterized protein n=1 Tax=Saponaria officinalis TaxID=3572 RepID=A0AAW1KU24_SAPOF
MEDDKKKRKNKKKKNKQPQHQHPQQEKVNAEDTSSNAGETCSQDQNHVEEPNHLNQVSRSVNGGLDDQSNTKVEGTGVHVGSNGTLSSSSADSEKQKWLQEEAKLREMVKQLLYEKDSYVRNQADLELRMKQLQLENESWHQKEVSLEQRIRQLEQEKADVSFEEGKLKEKIRHIEMEKFILVENENSNKELTTTLSNENTRLRTQVLELEGAQNNLSQENRQLIDNISALESRIRDLEKSLPAAFTPVAEQKDGSEEEDLNAQVEAAFALVEKLVTENAELVEKLNELYMELERPKALPDATSVEVSNYVAVPDPMHGPVDDFSPGAKQFEVVPIKDERVTNDDMDSEYGNLVRHSSDTAVSGEIVQIPLNENEVHDLEAQEFRVEADEGVPITDAPLIGAPFRLISFVAKYVSGADLVNSSSDSPLRH